MNAGSTESNNIDLEATVSTELDKNSANFRHTVALPLT